ncbi:hypothetical protein BDP27DRAFT_1385434 [Rhodocollybia butyracea]|uniref:Uncharacterized protein n=1 Tax=Rhodocollybia butyracea TaxID=206335 RepID=A0A9P5PD04_9AGAR|nr:hypothetical protein BDP27DRAFT_1385434 [Rhodocollybia butyracea]
MVLQPNLRPLINPGSSSAPHTLDIYSVMDYVCSAEMALTINSVLDPLLAEGDKYGGKAKVIISPQVQPWHASPLKLVSQYALLIFLRSKGTYPNGGNAVTDDLKYTSNTILWDGLVANEISGSWGEKEWTEFLVAKVAV